VTTADLAALRRARDTMDRDYARPLDVPALARAAHMSAGHFSRSFRAAFGETPYSYLMTRRIERAKALLRRGDLTVTEVCFEVGCSSLGSFSSRSPNWSGTARARTAPAATTRARPSRRASPRSSPDRSETEKPETLPGP
jgi:AraC-like DNA-binding protein